MVLVWTYLQSSNGDTDIENKPRDTGQGEEGEVRMYGESKMETYITICETVPALDTAPHQSPRSTFLCPSTSSLLAEAEDRGT